MALNYCEYCKRRTQIVRDYNIALMVVYILIFFPVAIAYYFMCKLHCKVCKGYEIIYIAPDSDEWDDDDKSKDADNNDIAKPST